MKHRLSDRIHAALLGEADWEEFLHLLVSDLPGGAAAFLMHRPDQAVMGPELGHGEAVAAEYRSTWGEKNPWIHLLADRHPGEGVAWHRIMAQRMFRKTEYFKGFLAPRGIGGGASIAIDRIDGAIFGLEVSFAERAPALEDLLEQRLGAIAATLRRISSVHARAAAARGTAFADRAEMCDSLGIGLIIIAPGMQAITVSAVARRLATDTEVLSLSPSGRVRFPDPQAQAIVSAMQSSVYTGPTAALVPHEACRMSFIRHKPDPMKMLLTGPHVALLMEPVGWERERLLVEATVRRFSLAPAEARALSGLVAGASIRSIAEDNGLSVETVRSQMKSLFTKTGANGQTDLLRMILRQ